MQKKIRSELRKRNLNGLATDKYFTSCVLIINDRRRKVKQFLMKI